MHSRQPQRMSAAGEPQLSRLPSPADGHADAIDSAAIQMLGVRIHRLNAPSLVAAAANAAIARDRAIIAYVNAHGLNLAYEQPRLRHFFNQRARWVFCDGFGVRWAARLSGLPTPERLTPPDWIDLLAQACVSNQLSLYLLGGAAAVAEGAAKTLVDRHPTLRIAGVQHGYFDKTASGGDNARVVDCINQAAPDVLLVGFGMPVQEYWLDDNWSGLNASIALTVGALFNVLAGTVRRAPKWMTDHGLEWAGRLLIEPSRLWRRYLVGNPLFLARVVRERLGGVKTRNGV